MAAGAGRVSPVVRAAVLGRPIAHSLSPALHRAALTALGLTGSEYTRAEVGAEELAGFLADHPEATGFSLTMPLKERLVQLAHERGWDLDETAEATGVANTLVRYPNATTVANTDVDGIIGAVAPHLRPEAGQRATVLGAGATARSALLALSRLGITEVDLLVRSASRAAVTADLGTRLGLAVGIGGLETIRSSAVVVSTLPAEAAPALEWEPGAGVVLDVAYAAESAILSAASAHGYVPVPGTAMLVEQAVAQAVLFLTAAAGTPPSPAQVETIAEAMHAALPERD